jgi:hypothetical protein
MVGEQLVIGLVFELAGIDAQLARWKLGKKIHPDHDGRQRPTAAMVTPPWHLAPSHMAIIQYDAQHVYVIETRYLYSFYYL